MLNFFFLLHTAVAFGVAFVLLVFHGPFTMYLADASQSLWPPQSPFEEIIIAYAWMTAAGLIVIGTAAEVARRSGHPAVRWAGLFCLTISCIAFIVAAFFLYFYLAIMPLSFWVGVVNLVFLLLYMLIVFFYRETI